MWKVRWRSWGGEQMGRMILKGACREIWAGLLVMQVLVQLRMALPLVLEAADLCLAVLFQRLVRPHLHQQLENDREVPVLAPPGVMTKNWKRFSTAVSVQENGAADRIHRVAPRTRNYSANIPLKANETKKPEEEEYLLVDGYNIIFAWEELRELSKVTIDGARQKLMDILCNYQGYKKCTLILVFDAYKVTGNTGEAIDYHNIHVVYTKEAETADQYIEKLAHKIGRQYNVTVATSDGLEQLIIYGQGCHLMSARDLKEEVAWANEQIREEKAKLEKSGKNYLFHGADEELAAYLEDVRLGRRE